MRKFEGGVKSQAARRRQRLAGQPRPSPHLFAAPVRRTCSSRRSGGSRQRRAARSRPPGDSARGDRARPHVGFSRARRGPGATTVLSTTGRPHLGPRLKPGCPATSSRCHARIVGTREHHGSGPAQRQDRPCKVRQPDRQTDLATPPRQSYGGSPPRPGRLRNALQSSRPHEKTPDRARQPCALPAPPRLHALQ